MEKFTRKISLVFIIIQAILYASFLTVDLLGANTVLSIGLKYSIILLCFCYALSIKNRAGRSILLCVKLGLFFTLISDLFILILDYYLYGVFTFIIVQQLYGIRIDMAKSNPGTLAGRFYITQSYLVRLSMQISCTALICYLLHLAGVQLELLLIVSVFYFICILTNVLLSLVVVRRKKKDKSFLLFTIGMVLFLLCDINVGLFNLSGFITLPEDVYQVVYSISSILMWTFYAPSQVLIALSISKVKANPYDGIEV